MSTAKLSVYLITLNESATIARALESVSGVDELIVVDSGSTDDTVSIAQSFGAKVIHQEWLGFAHQKAFALNLCQNEWCLNLDGDEALTAKAREELETVIAKDSADQIRFPIEDIFMGKTMHPLSRKRTIVRAFKKSKVRYPTDRLVHENIIGEGKVYRAKHPLMHHGYDCAFDFMEKYNRYAQLSAEAKFRKGKKASLLKLMCIFPFTFIKVLIFRKLFLSGTRGFVQAKIEAMYAFLKESYLYEKNFRSTENSAPNGDNHKKQDL